MAANFTGRLSVSSLVLAFLLCCSSFGTLASEPSSQHEQKPTEIKVGVLYSTTGHRGLLQELGREFEKRNPDITVRFEGHGDTKYKQLVPQWLASDGEIDVMYWQGGLRLKDYIKAGQVFDISEFWYEHNLAQAFPKNIADVVTEDNGIYGVPYAYYSWGMLYNKQILEKLSMSAPRNWQELKQLCLRARERDIFPFVVAGLEPWLPAAWFDYLNLRINGLDFHLNLLSGEESFLDDKVTNVFRHWAELIEADCFNKDYSELHWRHAMTSIYRQLGASTLIANFVDVSFPEEFLADFEFHSFPTINPDVPQYEDMPVDLFLIPQSSKRKETAQRFLLFMSQPDVQHSVGNVMAQSSAHIKALPPTGRFTQRNADILQYADGLAQYFDRDMHQGMVQDSLKIVNDFFSHADIEKAQKLLEDVRLKHLQSQKALASSPR